MSHRSGRRVRARSRRFRGQAVQRSRNAFADRSCLSWPPNQQIINVGELRVDCQAHRVAINSEEITLAAMEFNLLVTLIERRDRVQPRAALLSDVWGVDPHTTTRTVDTHVKRLRGKLGRAGRFIQTVRGVGYRFSETADGDN
jgi:two-component system phosphate regulon response regulator PhoB